MRLSRTLAGATIALLAVIALAAAPRGQAAKAAAGAEQAVLKADNARFDAMVKADGAALEKLLADELSYTHSNAQVQDKAAFIGEIK